MRDLQRGTSSSIATSEYVQLMAAAGSTGSGDGGVESRKALRRGGARNQEVSDDDEIGSWEADGDSSGDEEYEETAAARKKVFDDAH